MAGIMGVTCGHLERITATTGLARVVLGIIWGLPKEHWKGPQHHFDDLVSFELSSSSGELWPLALKTSGLEEVADVTIKSSMLFLSSAKSSVRNLLKSFLNFPVQITCAQYLMLILHFHQYFLIILQYHLVFQLLFPCDDGKQVAFPHLLKT